MRRSRVYEAEQYWTYGREKIQPLICTSVYLLLMVVVPIAAEPQNKSRPNPSSLSPSRGMIEIDGAQHPELLPEYLIWTQGFSRLAAIKRDDMTIALDTLQLAPRDADLAFAEAAKQDERDRRCSDQTRRIMEATRTAKPEKIEAAVRPAILECRWEVLAAKDRLLDAMSPEGRATLVNWMLDARKGMKAYIPKSDLEFFKQPK
jgi:hypothetical protein